MSGKQNKSFFFYKSWIAVVILSLAMIFVGCITGGGDDGGGNDDTSSCACCDGTCDGSCDGCGCAGCDCGEVERIITFDRTENGIWPDSLDHEDQLLYVTITTTTVGAEKMPPNPEAVQSGYVFEKWSATDGTDFTENTLVSGTITVTAQYKLDLPDIDGTATITGSATYKIGGTLTVNPNITNVIVSPSYKYQWQADNQDIANEINNTYTIKGDVAGKIITCVITHDGFDGEVKATGSKVPFDIHLDITGEEGADSVTAEPDYGHVGGSIKLNYTLANILANNQLVFSGVEDTDSAPITVPGTDFITFIISASDAEGATHGTITVYAAFTHSNKIIETIAFPHNDAAVTKTYGDLPFTNAIDNTLGTNVTARAAAYSSSDPSVASVNSSTGEVTIHNVGETDITATKTANATHNDAVATYKLNIHQKQLTISGTTVEKSREYEQGNTSASVTAVGSLTNVEPGNTVNVSAEAHYDSDTVGNPKNITVKFHITGTHAANYLPPEDIIFTDGAIIPVPLKIININFGETVQEAHLSAVGGTFDVINVASVAGGTPANSLVNGGNTNGYKFTAAASGRGSYVIFEAEFPSGTNLSNYEKVIVTHKPDQSSTAHKTLQLLVNNAEITGTHNDNSPLSAGFVSTSVGANTAVNREITISSARAEALKSYQKLYFTLFINIDNLPGSYEFSNINFIRKPIAPATVTPANATFNKNDAAASHNTDITFNVDKKDWDDFTNIKELDLNTGYTVNDGTVTVLASYLKTQSTGDLTLTFVFGASQEKTVKITIIDQDGEIVTSSYKTSYDFAVDTNISNLIRTTSASAVSANISEGHLNFVLVSGYTQEQVVVRFDLGNTTLADYSQIVITKSPATHTGSGTDWNNKPLNAKAMIAAETGAPSTAITAASGNLNFGNNTSITLTINGGGTLTGLVDIGFSTQNFPAGYTLRFSSITLVPK